MSKRFYEIFNRVNETKLNEDITHPASDEYRDELEDSVKDYADLFNTKFTREGKIPQTISFGDSGSIELAQDDALEFEGADGESGQPQTNYSVVYNGRFNNIPVTVTYRIVLVPQARYVDGGYTFDFEYFVDDTDVDIHLN